MKVCGFCVHYAECAERYRTAYTSRLTGNVCTRLFTVFPMQEYDFCSYGEHK